MYSTISVKVSVLQQLIGNFARQKYSTEEKKNKIKCCICMQLQKIIFSFLYCRLLR